MKKLFAITATLLLLALGSTLFAGEVKLEDARKVAVHFYYEKHLRLAGPVDLNVVAIRKVHVEHAGGVPVYYVFHMSPAGFVIVPAEDALAPVIGYSLDGHFEAENQPPNVQWWFQQYKDQVVYASENALQPELKIAVQWDHYLAHDFRHQPVKSGSREVAPLLSSSWNQGWPYNYYCPPGTPVGCVATAIAQILYYWRWPDQGQGYTSYISPVTPEYGVQSADFGNAWYRFDEMADQPQTVNLAIAEYSYHIAVAIHMNFGPGGSFPSTDDSLAYFFKIMPYTWYYRDSMPVEQWKQLLTESLDDKYPVYYSGWPASGDGHAFVCDGYQDENYYHFNLGWGGSSNGYYTIDDIAGFNFDQSMVPLICPDSIQFSYPLFCSGEDTLVAMEGSISDGSGPIHNYLNNTYASWLIDPQNEMDSVTNIVITFKQLNLYDDDDRVFVYDGADTTAPMLAELSGNNLPPPITSTGNKVFVEFITGEENTGEGFYLNYKTNRPVWCSGMTQLTAAAATFDDGSGDFYYNNNTTCLWMVNPGTGEPLTISFNYFDTEEGMDILQIHDPVSQTMLAELSGYYETPPEPVTSPSGRFFLAFSSNDAIRGKGWEIWYDVTAGNEDEEFKVQGSKFKVDVYPNPVSGIAAIKYDLTETAMIEMVLYNFLGQRVGNLEEGMKPAGTHQTSIDLSGLPAGLYFLRTSTIDHRQSAIHSGVVKLIKL
ncbi:MAG: C10 family peptidase [Bacteroidales bacterium]|nr:C10 family peptidase [Bacteroidales bacterium]